MRVLLLVSFMAGFTVRPGQAVAQSSADSLAAPAPAPPASAPDSVPATGRASGHDAKATKTRRAVPDTTHSGMLRNAYEEPKGFNKPRWVMMRSLALPGWGQVHNGHWIKAGVIAGLEAVYIGKLVDDKRALDGYNDQIEAARAAGDPATESYYVALYNDRSNTYSAHQWWFGAILAYSMLDAYIDAHFRNFRVGVDDDPALPPEERRALGLKVSWQEHF